MNLVSRSDELASDAELASALDGITCVLLIGGPSGSGKTTHALGLIGGSATSKFLQGHRGGLSRTDSRSLVRLSRTEAKSLARRSPTAAEPPTRERFPPGGLIIEFATNQLNGPGRIDATRAYIQALQRRTHVVGAHTIELSDWALFKRYLRRMRGPQLLHFGKIRTLARYALGRGNKECLVNWRALLAECGIENRPVSAELEDLPPGVR